VVTIGRGYFENPFMNGGRLLSDGFVRAVWAGVAAIRSSVHAILRWPLLEARAVSRYKAFDGAGAWRAASAVMANLGCCQDSVFRIE
jgi:hypothetical protein